MSNWYMVDIVFKEPAGAAADDYGRLSAVLGAVGAPNITKDGFSGTTQSMGMPVSLLCDFAHYLGFPCRGRRGPDYEGDGPMGEWHESQRDFTKNPEYANFWHCIDAGLVEAVRQGLAVAFPLSQALRAGRLHRQDVSGEVDTPPLLVALPEVQRPNTDQIILRTEFAKQPGTLPTAVVFYRSGDTFIVHTEAKMDDGSEAWARTRGCYEQDTPGGYEAAFAEYLARVASFTRWFAARDAFDRIDAFIEPKRMA